MAQSLPVEGAYDPMGNATGLPVEPAPAPVNDQDISYSTIINRLLGTGGEQRYQTWPERMVRDALAAPSQAVAAGNAPNPYKEGTEEWQDFESHRTAALPQALNMAALAGTGGLGGAGTKAGESVLGIVPVAQAKSLKVKATPPSELLKSAVENTAGASIDADGHLIMNVKRSQLPDQEMAESVRGGVFYLPKDSKYGRYYDSTTGAGKNNNYGGSQRIEGETAYLNPLLVKGQTGGKVGEVAYNTLMGDKKAYANLEKDAMNVVNSTIYKKQDPSIQYQLAQQFLEKHAPELSHYADYIVDNSAKGNQLRYALQEAAVASAARKAGHDGVIGYSVGRGENAGKPSLSEVFDVRENRYPSPEGDYSIHPEFYSDSSLPGMAISASRNRAFLRPALKFNEKIYKAPVGGQHLDALPKEMIPEFNRLAMSGEDISHYDFGFMNHKGQFLSREKALDYAIKEGLLDPNSEAARAGVLTSTMDLDQASNNIKDYMAAVRDKNNLSKIYKGEQNDTHPVVRAIAYNENGSKFLKNPEDGFVDKNGNFLNRNDFNKKFGVNESIELNKMIGQ